MTVRLIHMGLGLWGLNWAQNVVPNVPEVETVAWVDASEVARDRAVAAGLDKQKIFASFEDALAATNADALLATVPLEVHIDAVKAGLNAGLHVLVEKPFAESRKDAAAVVELAKSKGLTLAINQNYRYFAALVKARQMVEEGAVGTPQALRVHFTHLFGPDYRYFHLAEPLLSDMAIHHFDGMRFVLQDEPVAVSCTSWTEEGTPFQGPPAASALIRFSRGTIVRYDGSWISRGPTTPWGGQWQLDGSKASLRWTFRGPDGQRDAYEKVELYEPGQDDPVFPELPSLTHWDREGALDEFARVIGGAAPSPTLSTGADNVKSLDLMFALIASAAQGGAWLELDGAGGQTARAAE
ncbi:MAG: Gfo/Idh/MocA family oxidoreductase [Pseudomonadota bacterium]